MGGTAQLIKLSALKNINVEALREAIAMDVELIEDDLRCDFSAPVRIFFHFSLSLSFSLCPALPPPLSYDEQRCRPSLITMIIRI